MEVSATSINCPEDVAGAAKALNDIAMDIGNLRVAATENIASKFPMTDMEGNVLASSIFGWRETTSSWWKMPLLALNSPLPIACRYESEVFWCNANGFYTRQDNHFLDAIDISSFERLVRVPAVICVPVHLPFCQVGAVSFIPNEGGADKIEEIYSEHGVFLEHISRPFIAGYAKAMNKRAWIPTGCKLTKREVECLQWAAKGKTDQEIATLISRSFATVRFHMQRAGVKLDSVNRSQAIFKAAQLGFLGSVAVQDV